MRRAKILLAAALLLPLSFISCRNDVEMKQYEGPGGLLLSFPRTEQSVVFDGTSPKFEVAVVRGGNLDQELTVPLSVQFGDSVKDVFSIQSPEVKFEKGTHRATMRVDVDIAQVVKLGVGKDYVLTVFFNDLDAAQKSFNSIDTVTVTANMRIDYVEHPTVKQVKWEIEGLLNKPQTRSFDCNESVGWYRIRDFFADGYHLVLKVQPDKTVVVELQDLGLPWSKLVGPKGQALGTLYTTNSSRKLIDPTTQTTSGPGHYNLTLLLATKEGRLPIGAQLFPFTARPVE